MTITMFDSVDISTIPSNAVAVAGYVGGKWPTYDSLVKRFPHAHHLSIAVQANEHARCLDVEPGDATNAEAAGWFHHAADHSHGKPVFYTNADNGQALVNALGAAGIKRDEYFLWLAHFTDREHFCGPNEGFAECDLCQWTQNAEGRNLDRSIVRDDVFVTPKPKPPAPPKFDPHYDWFYPGPFDWGKYHNLRERQLVEQYDGARKRPIRYALYLRFTLKPKLKALADRVADQAIKEHPLPNGKPDWNKYNRGWRFQNLVHRSQGKQFVK